MQIQDVTEEYLEKVLRLYQEIIGGDISFLSPAHLLDDIRGGEAFFDGYRIGSQWDMHSKFRPSENADGSISFGFYSNFDPKDRSDDNPDYVAAREAGKRFTAEAARLG